MSVIFVVLCILSFARLSVAVCPTGSTLILGRCYFVYNSPYTNTWDECQTFCTSLDASMLCIQNQDQQNNVYWRVQTHGSYWLGATKTSGTNNLVWVPGCTSAYTSFAANEGTDISQPAVVAVTMADFAWSDVALSTASTFCLCQMENPPIKPTSQPSSQPTKQPFARPSGQPSRQPSRQPSSRPTCQPSAHPSAQPFGRPSAHPSSQPLGQPSQQPTSQPSLQPSQQPNGRPTCHPSTQPSAQPSIQPSSRPTQPTSQPSSQPSREPSGQPSCQPSSLPSMQPSRQPSSQPSFKPTRPTNPPSSQPTDRPSAQPSSQPSVSLQRQASILQGPVLRSRNGFAFAAVDSGGRAHTWGEAANGGDSSSVQSFLSSGVSEVVHSRFSFVARRTNGTLAAWGVTTNIRGDLSGVRASSVTCHASACAAVVTGSGAVHTIGVPGLGGDIADSVHCPGCATALAAGVDRVVASAGAFAALKLDGTVYVWGGIHYGATASSSMLALLQGVRMISATRGAFAGLLNTGRVLCWGDRLLGGDSSAVDSRLTSIWHIGSSKSGFVAYQKDSGIVVWGNPRYADASAVSSQLRNVVYVAHTYVASAAVRSNGGVVTWGQARDGGDSSAVQGQLHDIVKIFGNGRAFAALTSTGGVVAWGRAGDGGEVPADKLLALSSGVVSIYSTDRAFAALKSNGTVVVWGHAGHGGSPGAAVEALLTSGVHTVCANDAAFSAIKTDGKVVGWGHRVSVGTGGVQFVSSRLTTAATC